MGLSELIYNIIYYKINKKEKKSINNLPFLIFIFIIKFFYNFLYFFIIYKLSPIHAFLYYSISSVIFSFNFMSREIFYILLDFFCVLIFNIFRNNRNSMFWIKILKFNSFHYLIFICLIKYINLNSIYNFQILERFLYTIFNCKKNIIIWVFYFEILCLSTRD